jgi:lysophospholipase L1-like esterase
MASPTRSRLWMIKTAIVATSVLVTLGIAELAARLIEPKKAFPVSACKPCGYFYEINSAHEDASSIHLRDREFTPTPAPGVFRILVLGDSVAYGFHVKAEESFPKVLERQLVEKYGRVEVINSGVPGYSPYQELKYFDEKGAALRPDLVVVSFCMNDVADPSLHWQAFLPHQTLDHLPAEAIPNKAYHDKHVYDVVDEQRWRALLWRNQMLRRSALYKLVKNALPPPPPTSVERGGKRWPAFLVGEDSISIEQYESYDTPEWTWLRATYDKLAASVAASGASLAIVWNPVSYELDPAYPLMQHRALFARYCAERSIHCLDPLPMLREHRDDTPRPYHDTSPRPQDIWHYSPAGNRLVAGEIARFLEREKLFPAAKPGG